MKALTSSSVSPLPRPPVRPVAGACWLPCLDIVQQAGRLLVEQQTSRMYPRVSSSSCCVMPSTKVSTASRNLASVASLLSTRVCRDEVLPVLRRLSRRRVGTVVSSFHAAARRWRVEVPTGHAWPRVKRPRPTRPGSARCMQVDRLRPPWTRSGSVASVEVVQDRRHVVRQCSRDLQEQSLGQDFALPSWGHINPRARPGMRSMVSGSRGRSMSVTTAGSSPRSPYGHPPRRTAPW